HRSPSVLKKQRDHGGAGLSTPAGLSCDLGRLVAAFLTAIAMRMHEAHLAIREVAARPVLVPRWARSENDPGIKRLDHKAWPSLLALSVPIHDGKSNTTRMSASVRADTGGRYAPGPLMFRTLVSLTVLTLLTAAATTPSYGQKPQASPKDGEAKLIAVLKSDAPRKAKADACRELARVGTRESVAPLAALLCNEELSHMARYGLEPIPDPAVDTALRDTLEKVKGR